MEQNTPSFCPSCGAKVAREGQTFCEECGSRLDTETEPSATVFDRAYESSTVLRPMKWYNFVVYFLLFAGSAVNLVNAFLYLSGRYVYDYAVTSGLSVAVRNGTDVYAEFPSLRILDVAYGIVLALMAAYALFVRGMLVRYKKEGPKLFLLYYIAGFVFSAIVTAGSTVITGGSIYSVIAALVISAIESAVLVLLNYIYFKKRSAMFIN